MVPHYLFLLITALGLIMTGTGCAPAPTPPPVPTTPPLADELIFYDWADDMPQSVLDAFTAEYGVPVVYESYESQEEAMENIRAGNVYDVVVFDNNFIPRLVSAGLIIEIDYHNVPNFKNISINFRDLAYDPENKHSIPFNWGTTGLVYRRDLAAEPISKWADLWDPRYAGQAAIWRGQEREVVGLALKSLGYSANSEDPAELEQALARLIELKPNILFLEDLDVQDDTSGYLLAEGKLILAMGYANDVLVGRAKNPAVDYVLPEEGALMWGDNFVILANSARQYSAELFLNFILRPEISAEITNGNRYASTNDAARPFINPEILNDPVIFPANDDIKNAEIVLPLSPAGRQLHETIMDRFLAATP